MTANPISQEQFSTALPVIVLTRPKDEPKTDWQEFDRGEGIIHLPANHDISIRIHNIDDADLNRLVRDLAGLHSLTALNLSENRKITDDGIKFLKDLPQLTWLNLSSCSITNAGLVHLQLLKKLEHLDLSYCNRLTDPGLKSIKSLSRLTFIDLQGCVKLTTAGLARMRRAGLTIHR